MRLKIAKVSYTRHNQASLILLSFALPLQAQNVRINRDYMRLQGLIIIDIIIPDNRCERA